MIAVKPGRVHPVLIATATFLMAVAVGVAIVALGRFAAPALALTLAASAFMLLSPRAAGAVTIALFLLIPTQYMALPLPPWLPVAGLALTWVALRGGLLNGLRRLAHSSIGVVLIGLVSWLIATSFTGVSPATSVRWVIGFSLLVLLFAVVAAQDGTLLDSVRAAFVFVTAVLGAFAVVETYVLQDNPLFGELYVDAASGGFVQFDYWSVYRATTTLGHPLLNGTVFAVGAALALGRAVQGRSWPMALATVLCAAGVVSSGSRSAVVALLVGAASTLALALWAGRASRRRALKVGLAGVLVVSVAGSVIVAPVIERENSREGIQSAASRSEFRRQGLQLVAERPILGVGPGALTVAARSSGIAQSGNFENSYLEFAIASGVFGLVLLVVLYALCLRASWTARDSGLAGAIVAYAVCQAAFNLIQAYVGALVLLGLLVGAAVSDQQKGRRLEAGGPGPASLRWRLDLQPEHRQPFRVFLECGL